MDTIRNWVATRSGPNMTVAGWTPAGERVKITGVAEIVSSKDGVIATTKADDTNPDGIDYLLAVGAAD